MSNPHTPMYTPNRMTANWQKRLADLDADKLDRLTEWNLAQIHSCQEGIMRSDQAYEQRLKFLHNLLDSEALHRSIMDEQFARLHTPCMTCSDEGHVEDPDSPYDTIRECPTCS